MLLHSIDSLASTGVSDAEVGAAGELAKCEAAAKNRRRTTTESSCQGLVLRLPRVHEGEAQVEHDAVLEARARDVAELAQ